MRILLVNKYLHLKSGTERYLFNLKQLLQHRDHVVEVFAMKHPLNQEATYQDDFVREIDFHRVPLLKRFKEGSHVIWYADAAKRIARVLDDFRPDVVHLLNIYHQISPSILPPIRQRGIPIIQTLNDYKLFCPNYLLFTQGHTCTRCLDGRYWPAVRHRCLHNSRMWSTLAAVEMTLHKILRVYEKNVQMFLAPSRFMEQIALRSGIKPFQIELLPYFIDVSNIQPARVRAADYFAYFGRLSQEKGLPTLIGSMRNLPQGKLVICGDGPLQSHLESLVSTYKLQNVHFAGHLAGPNLFPVLQEAQFTILPSEWYEVFGQSIIESMAIEKPVIGSRIGGIPELIDDGSDGLLFEPGNEDGLAECIQKLLTNKGMSQKMGQRGRQKVLRRYSPQTHYEQLFELYKKLTS